MASGGLCSSSSCALRQMEHLLDEPQPEPTGGDSRKIVGSGVSLRVGARVCVCVCSELCVLDQVHMCSNWIRRSAEAKVSRTRERQIVHFEAVCCVSVQKERWDGKVGQLPSITCQFPALVLESGLRNV